VSLRKAVGFGARFYPSTKTCYLAFCACTESPSSEGGVVFTKLVATAVTISDECSCPSETFQGRVYHHLIYSDQLSVGSRHVAARNVTGGAAAFEGLFVRYVHAAAFSLTLALASDAIEIEAHTVCPALTGRAASLTPYYPDMPR
jgi:hypothetical protein